MSEKLYPVPNRLVGGERCLARDQNLSLARTQQYTRQ